MSSLSWAYIDMTIYVETLLKRRYSLIGFHDKNVFQQNLNQLLSLNKMYIVRFVIVTLLSNVITQVQCHGNVMLCNLCYCDQVLNWTILPLCIPE